MHNSSLWYLRYRVERVGSGKEGAWIALRSNGEDEKYAADGNFNEWEMMSLEGHLAGQLIKCLSKIMVIIVCCFYSPTRRLRRLLHSPDSHPVRGFPVHTRLMSSSTTALFSVPETSVIGPFLIVTNRNDFPCALNNRFSRLRRWRPEGRFRKLLTAISEIPACSLDIVCQMPPPLNPNKLSHLLVGAISSRSPRFTFRSSIAQVSEATDLGVNVTGSFIPNGQWKIDFGLTRRDSSLSENN